MNRISDANAVLDTNSLGVFANIAVAPVAFSGDFVLESSLPGLTPNRVEEFINANRDFENEEGLLIDFKGDPLFPESDGDETLTISYRRTTHSFKATIRDSDSTYQAGYEIGEFNQVDDQIIAPAGLFAEFQPPLGFDSAAPVGRHPGNGLDDADTGLFGGEVGGASLFQVNISHIQSGLVAEQLILTNGTDYQPEAFFETFGGTVTHGLDLWFGTTQPNSFAIISGDLDIVSVFSESQGSISGDFARLFTGSPVSLTNTVTLPPSEIGAELFLNFDFRFLDPDLTLTVLLDGTEITAEPIVAPEQGKVFSASLRIPEALAGSTAELTFLVNGESSGGRVDLDNIAFSSGGEVDGFLNNSDRLLVLDIVENGDFSEELGNSWAIGGDGVAVTVAVAAPQTMAVIWILLMGLGYRHVASLR